jgi:hypothetical protein
MSSVGGFHSRRGRGQNERLDERAVFPKVVMSFATSTDSVAEWSKALASGASPKGRGFEPHRCHLNFVCAPPFKESQTFDSQKNTSRGARTRDHGLKRPALYRLS